MGFFPLIGIYKPGTTSPVTIKIQLAAYTTGPTFILGAPITPSIQWTVEQIAP